MVTFGFNEKRVLPSLRLLPYDALFVLAGRASLRTKGFARLKSLEPTLRTIAVDPFDFVACLDAACAAIYEGTRDGGVVRVGVSGGTKILAAAAMLAAFQEGAEAWYCDPEPLRLPVLRGVRITDALSDADRLVASLLRGAKPMDEVVRDAGTHGLSRPSAFQALRDLTLHGLVEERLERGHVVVAPSAALAAHRAHFRLGVARKG